MSLVSVSLWKTKTPSVSYFSLCAYVGSGIDLGYSVAVAIGGGGGAGTSVTVCVCVCV